MIFVTVGTMRGFERLIKKMDDIAGEIEEKVIMQIGFTKYQPKNSEYFNFMQIDKMIELYKKSRIVVCHAGTGSIIMALENGKPVIAVPRREKYGEHIDDHQLDIAGELEKEGLITVAYDEGDIEKLIKSQSIVSGIKFRGENTLVKNLKDYINGVAKKKMIEESICTQ